MRWLDYKTRALFVDFTFYNANLDLFAICRAVFEFFPSGRVYPFTSIRIVAIGRYKMKDFMNFIQVGAVPCFSIVPAFMMALCW